MVFKFTLKTDITFSLFFRRFLHIYESSPCVCSNDFPKRPSTKKKSSRQLKRQRCLFQKDKLGCHSIHHAGSDFHLFLVFQLVFWFGCTYNKNVATASLATINSLRKFFNKSKTTTARARVPKKEHFVCCCSTEADGLSLPMNRIIFRQNNLTFCLHEVYHKIGPKGFLMLLLEFAVCLLSTRQTAAGTIVRAAKTNMVLVVLTWRHTRTVLVLLVFKTITSIWGWNWWRPFSLKLTWSGQDRLSWSGSGRGKWKKEKWKKRENNIGTYLRIHLPYQECGGFFDCDKLWHPYKPVRIWHKSKNVKPKEGQRTAVRVP